MAQQPMRSEEELCPTNLRFPLNKCNVRIDPDEAQDEPLFKISLEFLKNNTIYNALTLTTNVPVIYMQQFWHTVYKNKQNNKYFFVFDYKWFEIRTELIRNVPTPKKKKDVVPRCSRTIFADDNVLFDPNEAFEKQINKEVDKVEEGYQHLKVKLKAKEQLSPDAQLLLNLRRQNKESKKQSILEDIKRKKQGEDSDHDESDNDSKNGDKSDKSNFDEERTKSDKSDKDFDDADDQTQDFVINTRDKKPKKPSKTIPTPKTIHETYEQDTSTPLATPPTKTKNKQAKTLMEKEIKKKTDLKKAVMQRLTNLDQNNHADIIKESVQENVLNEVKNQLPKFFPKDVSDYVQPRLEKMICDVLKKNPINMFQSSSTPVVTFTDYELKKKLYDMMQNSHSFLNHKKHLNLYISFINSMDSDESTAQGNNPSH
nr:hypothetical protein [Tanacetum cinerariifolium]